MAPKTNSIQGLLTWNQTNLMLSGQRVSTSARLALAVICIAANQLHAAEPAKNPTNPPPPNLSQPATNQALAQAEQEMLQLLDAPLLFVKRHSYSGIHIYDTYYKWPPGGGGIYVLENPRAPKSEWKIRPVMDSTTPGTLGNGVYTHPELSWDAKKLLFCYKGSPEASTCIYEIGLDGQGLRRIADPSPTCIDYKGTHSGQHDIAPAYLPDGRIVFLSTRPSGLVPCANEGVSILHVMNADGSDLHPISVNNVNEFDPSILPDGRILIGGEFTHYNTNACPRIARLKADGTFDPSFNPGVGADNTVYSIAVQADGNVVLGGRFAHVFGFPRNGVARLLGSGALDSSFNPGSGTTNTIWSVLVQPDGKILIAGDFLNYNGQQRVRLARLMPDGSLDASFQVGYGPNNTVFTLAPQPDGNIVIGGSFTQVFGNDRAGVARVFGDNFLVPTKLGLPAPGLYGVSLTFTVQPNATYVLSASPDLRHWTDLTTNVAAGVVNTYTDTNAPAPSYQFYRLRVVAP